MRSSPVSLRLLAAACCSLCAAACNLASNERPGAGPAGPDPDPAYPGAAQSWLPLVGGADHFALLAPDGTPWLWGDGRAGQLGGATAAARPLAAPWPGVAGAVSIAAGRAHTCALSADGAVTCVGSDDRGQLGGVRAAQPLRLPPGAQAISAGADHTCAIVDGGRVACWGRNDAAQSGDPRPTALAAPRLVDGLLDTVALAAGSSHSCALDSAGAVRCWGANDHGQRGDGDPQPTARPVKVAGLPPVTLLAAGDDHSCAASAVGTWCWGRNDRGQLGDGTTRSASAPVAAGAVADLGAPAQLALGASHSCALIGTAVYCWGDGALGQLGLGDVAAAERDAMPLAVALPAAANAIGAAANTTCAHTAVGQVFCWGDNRLGQRGCSAETPAAVAHAVGADEAALSPAVRVTGRVGFDISSRTVARDTNGIWWTSWSAIHRLRRRFDPQTGAPVSGDDAIPGALTPLPGTVQVSPTYFGGKVVCRFTATEASRDGEFAVTLPRCPFYLRDPSPEALRVRVDLRYPVRDAGATLGTLRALWLKADVADFHPIPFAAPQYTRDKNQGGETVTEEYILPAAYFERRPKQWSVNGSLIKLGIVEVLGLTPAVARGALGFSLVRWQTLVEAHHALYDALVASGVGPSYSAMFVDDPAKGCDGCYTFNMTSAGGPSGGARGMQFGAGPKADQEAWLDGPSITTHELGHGVHEALAPRTFDTPVGGFNFMSRDPDGTEDSHIHWLDQIQSLRTGLIEGVAAALSEYLVNGCDDPWKDTYVQQGPEPRAAYNIEADPSCDAVGAKRCGYQYFRWQMTARGVAEGSSDWNTRALIVQTLNAEFRHAAGQISDDPAVPLSSKKRYVTSASETRYGMFLCDLLRGDPDIGHDGGARSGRHYLRDDVAFLVGKGYDGVRQPHALVSYAADVQPKTTQLTLGQLLEALDQFVDGNNLPALNSGDPQFAELALSVDSPLSPQSFGGYLIKRGWITRAELNNILRANYMQQLE